MMIMDKLCIRKLDSSTAKKEQRLVYCCIIKLNSTEMSLSNLELLGGEDTSGSVGVVEVEVVVGVPYFAGVGTVAGTAAGGQGTAGHVVMPLPSTSCW